MRTENAKNRSPKNREGGDIGDFEGKSGVVGVSSEASRKSWNDEIGISGENSRQEDTPSAREQSSSGINGKIVRQLIKETERQLAYYKDQTTELETRLQELLQLNQDLEQDETKNQE
nr:hypothetical protein [Fortiea contorta]